MVGKGNIKWNNCIIGGTGGARIIAKGSYFDSMKLKER